MSCPPCSELEMLCERLKPTAPLQNVKWTSITLDWEPPLSTSTHPLQFVTGQLKHLTQEKKHVNEFDLVVEVERAKIRDAGPPDVVTQVARAMILAVGFPGLFARMSV